MMTEEESKDYQAELDAKPLVNESFEECGNTMFKIYGRQVPAPIVNAYSKAWKNALKWMMKREQKP